MRSFFVLLIVMGFSAAASADELDPASQEALQKTQALMKDPLQRDGYIRKNPDAAAADKRAKDLVGAGHSDQMYDLSSDVFADLVKKTNGDPEKQKQLIEQANKDPEAFFNSLSPAQKQRIEDMAKQLQLRNPSAQNPD